MNILVTGATGYMGGLLTPLLLAQGHAVTCLVRDPSRLSGQQWDRVRLVRADALLPETLAEAFDGIDIAYYLIHSMTGGERGFEERDRCAAQNFAAAAKAAGVKRIVYLGGLGGHAGKLSSHLQSRQETGEVLRAYGPAVTEFRAAVIVGNGSTSFEIIRYLTERLPIMVCPRWVVTRVQPIAVADVLAYLLAALDEPRAAGQVFEIGGATVETYASMMRTYAAVRGLRRRLLRVPVLTPRLSSYWLDLVTPIPPAISRPLIEGLRSEVVCSNNRAPEVFPGIHPVGYEEAVRQTVNRGPGKDPPLEVGQKRALVRSRGLIRDIRQTVIQADPASVFAIVEKIGGSRGWFYANSLWSLRGLIDRAFGGIGMRRGRSHPDTLSINDAVDFWRVDAVEPGRLIRLRAEIKLPGRAWLQFQFTPRGGGTLLRTTAIFEPLGLLGELYWFVLYPVHAFILNGMHRAIAAAAEGLKDSR
jgi:uncharacterized protein YbjT (DUF2867 family)